MKYINQHIKVICFWAFLIPLIFMVETVFAQDDERIFTVFGVEVDITDRTATIAQSKAFFEAEKIAFYKLLNKIAELDPLQDLPDYSSPEIRTYVRGIEVVEERSSNVRYIATLNVSFDSEKIAELLGRNRIKFSEIGSKPFVILPIIKMGNIYHLWQFDNLWRKSLEDVDLKNRLLDYQIALGGFKDELELPVGLALRPTLYNRDRFRAFAQRYGAEDILILVLESQTVTPEGRHVLNVKYIKAVEGGEFEATKIIAFPNETPEEHFKRAQEIIFDRLDLVWKYQTLTTFGQFNDLELVVLLSSASEFIEIREKINSMAIVEEFSVSKLALPEANIALRYQGGWEQLRLSMEQSSLELFEHQDGWALRKKR